MRINLLSSLLMAYVITFFVSSTQPVYAATVTAVLIVPLDAVKTGEAVNLDASMSTSTTAAIVGYEFKIDDGGWTGMSLNDHHTTSFTYAGEQVVRMRVLDSEGDYGEDEQVINVIGFTEPVTVVSRGVIGQHTSMAIVNRRPAIAYYDMDKQALYYVRASDYWGKEWNDPVLIDDEGDVGQYCSLSVINGYPAISYYDADNGDLLYARTVELTGEIQASWLAHVTIASRHDYGKYCSLAEINGHPAVSFHDETFGRLMYERSPHSRGDSWGGAAKVVDGAADSVTDVGEYTTLVDWLGEPMISYYNVSERRLYVIQASDSDGADWSEEPKSLIPDQRAGRHASMALISSRPAIAFSNDEAWGSIGYIRRSFVYNWADPVLLSREDSSESYCSLAEINGMPAISYHNDR